MKPPVAFSYIRFSHPDQAKGDSLRRQTELRDAWLGRNGVALDASLTLEDKGISGFSGEHRTNPDRHALAAFLYAVEKKRIARGSYLIVESLDRLSREDILPALTLVLNLIQAGVRVVQLLPIETVYDEKTNPMAMMMMIMELSRGHSESAMKSERVSRAWTNKKNRAAAGEPMTANGPGWLRLVAGKWEVDEGAAAAIRHIYARATAGYGLGAITKQLNADGVPVIGRRAKLWARSSVSKILQTRTVVGEYQPHTARAGERVADGPPVANYYPAVVTEEQWYAARAACSSRRGKAGRPASGRVNLFAGLLRDARDGGTVQVTNKGRRGAGQTLVSYNAIHGVKGTVEHSFPARAFEEAVLSCLREIDPREILPGGPDAEDVTLELAGRLGEVEAREDAIGAKLADPRFAGLDALAEAAKTLADEKERLTLQLAQARQVAASPLSEVWGECQSLLAALGSAPDQGDARIRLRGALRRIVESAWMLVVPRGSIRLAAVQLWFAGGGRSRSYLILHRPARANAAARTEGGWECRSLASDAPAGGLDLRDPKHAARLASALERIEI
jgi:DNA invertase Pin-like site-specific DNA recombinase